MSRSPITSKLLNPMVTFQFLSTSSILSLTYFLHFASMIPHSWFSSNNIIFTSQSSLLVSPPLPDLLMLEFPRSQSFILSLSSVCIHYTMASISIYILITAAMSPEFKLLSQTCFLNFKLLYTTAYLPDALSCQIDISHWLAQNWTAHSRPPANLFHSVCFVFSFKWMTHPFSCFQTKISASFQIFPFSHPYPIFGKSCCNILKYIQYLIISHNSHCYHLDTKPRLLLFQWLLKSSLNWFSCFHLCANDFNTTASDPCQI